MSHILTAVETTCEHVQDQATVLLIPFLHVVYNIEVSMAEMLPIMLLQS